jgi:hypothetical protein
MPRITLQFCATDGIEGWVIRWFTQAIVNHVDVVLPNGTLLGAQLASGLGGQPSGVRIRPAGYVPMPRRYRATFTVDQGRYDAFMGFLSAQLGKPYDRAAIVAFAVGRDWRDDRAWFCSELVVAALEQAGIIPELCVLPSCITPQDLMLAINFRVPVTLCPEPPTDTAEIVALAA